MASDTSGPYDYPFNIYRTLIAIRFDLVCMYKRKINLIQFQKIKMRLTGLEAHDVAIEA